MAARMLVSAPRTFADLVAAVRGALIRGQACADRAYLESYHNAGVLIQAHLLPHRERAAYGAQVIPRLARALGSGDRLLYRCLQFAREYRILSGRTEWGWTHYRVLLEVSDKTRRQSLETAARKSRWNAEELERHVRAFNAIEVTATEADAGPAAVAVPKLLVPQPATLG